ncbi:MAG: hypothetical protein Q8P24_06460 [Desulfobacterales bacterium]|nr:hypothetical protein [Desulfobacterales bacterium]
MKQAGDCTHQPLTFRAHIAIGLVSGAVIAYELFVMRVFANGGWSHFGSTVVSIAMFGFGVFSTVLCLWNDFFSRRTAFFTDVSLLCLGPLMIFANTFGQMVPFNPLFLVSNPSQKYYLILLFFIYFLPFLCAAMFIGLVFLSGRATFGRVYFANMSGSGLGGAALFACMYWLLPDRLFLVPLAVWVAGALLWFRSRKGKRPLVLLAAGTALALVMGFGRPQINVSEFKGVSYARNFPDAEKVYQKASPFGFIEVYSSAYFHFAPGLSDTAALHLKEMPKNAHLGMYIDGNGPMGLMKPLSESQSEYFRFLPMSMPYLLKQNPETLVMQFGGGISTLVALKLGADRVVVAEGDPMIIEAVREDPYLSEFTGHILRHPKVDLVPVDGRIHVRREHGRFDVVDLSLIDSTGLSMAGGSSIYEKYTYTKETIKSTLRALKNDGILAVTVWNKEDPPKSTLKLMRTIVQAAKESGTEDVSRKFFMCHTYLSTLTILFKQNGFTEQEDQVLTQYCRKMSFEIVHRPGGKAPGGSLPRLLQAFRDMYFNPQAVENMGDEVDMSASNLYRHAAFNLISGQADLMADGYVFDNRELTNNRPYFAGFVRARDIPGFLDKLESVSDEWGYLLLWVTLLLSVIFGLVLMSFPMVFGWKAAFSRHRGKPGIIAYFICLGLGYMLVEITLISKYVLLLGNPTVTVSVLIPGMLVFSGLGSYVSERFVGTAHRTMGVIALAVTGLILFYVWGFDYLLGAVGDWPYVLKTLVCLALLFPLAFLMGFPFALGMATLASLKKEVFFVWAWGINGSFSVVGSVLVPVLAVLFGLNAVLLFSALLYLLTWPSFFFLKLQDRR